MPAISFEIWCICGEGLCGQTKSIVGGVIVEPCQRCLDRAHDEGYNDGYDKGYDDGKENI